ncbi:hypothetical protein, partial [Pedobacter sp. ASV12]|uniref:hypothetical protein n=1 Tax=Pedobacter sp. ASV12 TaxID=2795120 RepID=UPI0018EB1888
YYARNSSIHENFRRKAIYELIFLSNEFYEVDYENLGRRERPAGSLVGLENDIRFYFGDLSAFERNDDLENARIIIGVLVGAIGNKQSDISLDEIKRWFLALFKKISKKLLTATDSNEKCSLLEQKGMMLMGINRIRDRSAIEFLEYFDEMLALSLIHI